MGQKEGLKYDKGYFGLDSLPKTHYLVGIKKARMPCQSIPINPMKKPFFLLSATLCSTADSESLISSQVYETLEAVEHQMSSLTANCTDISHHPQRPLLMANGKAICLRISVLNELQEWVYKLSECFLLSSSPFAAGILAEFNRQYPPLVNARQAVPELC